VKGAKLLGDSRRVFLRRLPEGVSEIYCRPAMRRWSGLDVPARGYDPAAELVALVGPDVIALAERSTTRQVPIARARA